MIGQRVRVHFNLRTKLWSVTALSGPDKGRVIANLDDITLTDAELKVSAAGAARCARLGKRTVHAWAWGVVAEVNASPRLGALTRVTYNPKRDACFNVADTREPVHTAARVTFAKTTPDAQHGYAWI